MFENEIAGTPRPAGWDAATIYAWLKEGTGPERTTDKARDAWEDVAKRYDGVRETVRQALRDGQVAFEGDAGDAMQQRVEPLAAHADTAQQAALSTADTIGQQGTDFRDARNKVEPPVTVPDKPFLNDLAPWETDYDEAKADARDADEHNIRVLSDYGDATLGNVSSLPQFEQPPSVTPQLDVPASTATQVPGSGSALAGGGGAAGGSTGALGVPGGGGSATAVPPGGGSAIGAAPPPGGGSGGGAATVQPVQPGRPGTGAPGSAGLGRGAGPVVPAPVPFGAGGLGGDSGRERWRRTQGPGLFGNFNAGRSAAGAGGGAAAGKTPDPGKGAPGSRGPATGPSAGTAASPASGARGAPGAGMAAAPGAARKEEDTEHETKYIEKTDEHWGDGRAVAPPVIGADPPKAEPER